MLVEIDGWQGGGKSVLVSLLDGHPNVFSSLVHDYSFRAFLRPESDWSNTLQRRDIVGLRQLLATTRYFAAEESHLQGESVFDISSSVRMRVPFEYDFYAFDQQLIQTLSGRDVWTPESIVHEIYREMAVQSGAWTDAIRYFVSMSVPTDPASRNRFRQVLPSAKSILVYRDPRNILTTRANRVQLHSAEGDDGYSKQFSALLGNFELERINEYYALHRAMQRQHPSQFYEVEFTALVNDTERAMRGVAEFLDIDWSDMLTKPTRLGVILEKDGVSMVGSELDRWDALLSAEQQRAVRRRVRLSRIYQLQYQIAQATLRRARPVVGRLLR